MAGIPVQPKTCSTCQTGVPSVDSTVTKEPGRSGLDTYKYWNTNSEKGSWKSSQLCKQGKKWNILFNILFVGDQIHLWKDVDMRKFKLNHSRKRSHATTDVFGYITDKLDQEKQSKSGLDFGSVSSLPIKFLFMSQKKKKLLVTWTCESRRYTAQTLKFFRFRCSTKLRRTGTWVNSSI